MTSQESFTCEQIAGMIDHSLLNPKLTTEELDDGCRLAGRYGAASVCIMPYYVARCSELLAGSGVETGTTIGFPHGGHATDVKVAEAKAAIDDGASELDMVVNISQVLSSEWDCVRDDIAAVLAIARDAEAKLKVIFENCYLSDEQKVRLCEICGQLSVDWVKTSTGYGSSGATLDDVRLMRKHSPAHVQVKAAGGIRDLDTLLAFRSAGVTRIGATRTAGILDECRDRLGA